MPGSDKQTGKHLGEDIEANIQAAIKNISRVVYFLGFDFSHRKDQELAELIVIEKQLKRLYTRISGKEIEDRVRRGD